MWRWRWRYSGRGYRDKYPLGSRNFAVVGLSGSGGGCCSPPVFDSLRSVKDRTVTIPNSPEQYNIPPKELDDDAHKDRRSRYISPAEARGLTADARATLCRVKSSMLEAFFLYCAAHPEETRDLLYPDAPATLTFHVMNQ
ncbi:hypothetical protein TREMEDRAFT_65366 [Tremella mesenterica DSM 1558]|uniref:uncharacterized protein n=1 Tax=Tremella mesenterica (strain ATCC 24925 / CBS 8224 / DSM 1558 / NBRC 9311 / NRRL Y-6157 / RJB 2259-6 / UBC 559-6) TaxID=578456 RepID=UPI00032CAD5D|nr:uncharacterized protein TREMEDRAFT_65366 [Tremella mesenterica DSM 1558]EIW66503.1 hypothetical protein TREMEDRAFT_65366 [Tremella mesenterica DSM 1558]